MAAVDIRSRIATRRASHLPAETVSALARRSDVVAMKVFFRNDERRAELSALVTVAIVLAIVVAAKVDAATALFHIGR
jgi:hypothetical protein